MEEEIQGISSDLVKNLRRFKSLVDLKKTKVKFVDYGLLLQDLGVPMEPMSNFKANSSGFFYNEKNEVLNTLVSTLNFTEFYAEEGVIKFLRYFEPISPDTTIVNDTYITHEVETTIIYELRSDFIDDDYNYPKLLAKNEPFYLGLEKIDSLDNLNTRKPPRQHFLEDDREEYVPSNEEGYSVIQKNISQIISYELSDYVLATLVQDSDSFMSLIIQNDFGQEFSDKYIVKSSNVLALSTILPFKEIKTLDEILNDENNSEREIIHFMADWFKNHEATIINTYKKPQRKTFYEGMKLLNLKISS